MGHIIKKVIKGFVKTFIIAIIILFSLLIFLLFILPTIAMKNPAPTYYYHIKQKALDPYSICFSMDDINIKGATHYKIIYKFNDEEKTTALTKLGNSTNYIKIPKDITKIPIASIEIYNENKNKCIKKFKHYNDINIPNVEIHFNKPILNSSKKTKTIELNVWCNFESAAHYKIFYEVNGKEESSLLTSMEYSTDIEVPEDVTQIPITLLEIYGEDTEEPMGTFKNFAYIDLTNIDSNEHNTNNFRRIENE